MKKVGNSIAVTAACLLFCWSLDAAPSLNNTAIRICTKALYNCTSSVQTAVSNCTTLICDAAADFTPSICAAAYTLTTSICDAAYNFTAAICETAFNCAASVLDATQEGNDLYESCDTEFENCMYGAVFRDRPPLSEACYISRGEWTNFYLATATFFVVIVADQWILPAFSKATDNVLNMILAANPETHPKTAKLAKVVGFFCDANRNNVIEPGERSSPRTLVTFTSLCLPVVQLGIAIIAQEKCDHDKDVYAYEHPWAVEN